MKVAELVDLPHSRSELFDATDWKFTLIVLHVVVFAVVYFEPVPLSLLGSSGYETCTIPSLSFN